MPRVAPPFDPEEVLSDITQYPYARTSYRVESPIRHISLRLFLIASIGILGFFGYRVFSLTVLQGADLSEAALETRERAFLIPPTRGAILDSAGEIIVDNKPSFALLYNPLAAKTAEMSLSKKLSQVSDIVSVSLEELELRISEHGNRADPLILVSDVGQELAVTLAARVDGEVFRVQATALRRYYGDARALSNIIGYVGALSEKDLEEYTNYNPNEAIGKDGVERYYEAELRGEPGERRVTVDSSGGQQGDASVVEPSTGSALRLTVDRELAEKTYEALAAGVRASGADGGSAVILDPNTGAVLAMANVPTYNPAELSGGISQDAYLKIASNPKNPFLNRAVAGLYPPGSTLKPFVAAAALEENVVTPKELIDASRGSITVKSVYDDTVSWTFLDWKPHGFVNLFDALAVSSNVYFYTVGGGFGDVEGLGVGRLASYLTSFGFGNSLGVDIPGEVSGRIPTPEWKRDTIGEDWYIGDTYNMAIGQGNVAVTPLQLATATAAIANGGTVWRPYVLDAILNADGSEKKIMEPEVISKVPVAPEQLANVRRGMRQAVIAANGTNRALASLGISSAAKTGTAQYGSSGRTHGLVTAFAPYQNPELVLSVVLEGGGQGTAATYVARDILEWYALRATNE